MKKGVRLSDEWGIVPLPLVIGVSGHRDLREEDYVSLEAQVRLVFAEFQVCYPSTPLLLLSPLADGADRLVARVTLAKRIRLIVLLPLPQALYEEDFKTRGSRDEFHKLLHQTQWWFDPSSVKSGEQHEASS